MIGRKTKNYWTSSTLCAREANELEVLENKFFHEFTTAQSGGRMSPQDEYKDYQRGTRLIENFINSRVGISTFVTVEEISENTGLSQEFVIRILKEQRLLGGPNNSPGI